MPPLSNQYILMTLGTSMAAVFGVEELTGRAFNINSTTFRSIEIFTTTAALYVVVTFVATLLLAVVGPLRVPGPRSGALDVQTRSSRRSRRSSPATTWLLLGEAALTTLLLSAVGCLAGLLIGFGIALARLSHRRHCSGRSECWRYLYVEICSGACPFLVTLMLFFFGAQVLGIDLSPRWRSRSSAPPSSPRPLWPRSCGWPPGSSAAIRSRPPP